MVSDDCVFCRIVSGQEKSWKVYEDRRTLAFFDVNPVSEYHNLVVPKRHFTNIFDVPATQWTALSRAVKAVVDRLAEKTELRHVQILNSSGAAAQQDVFHLHLHVVPRRLGDGLDIDRAIHPEWRGHFDALLGRLT